MSPLFIPLRRQYFEAFLAGTKTVEYRRAGARWNRKTCAIGRAVTLSLGYGLKHRLSGTIVSFAVIPAHGLASTIYPEATELAAIEIEIDRNTHQLSAQTHLSATAVDQIPIH